MVAAGNRDATCMLVLISPDIARVRLSFRRIVLFYVSTPLKLAALFAANEQMPCEKGDSKMNMYTYIGLRRMLNECTFPRKIRERCNSARGHAIPYHDLFISRQYSNNRKIREIQKKNKQNAKSDF